MPRFLSLFGLSNPIATLDPDEIWPTEEELNEDREFNRAFAIGMAEDQSATIAQNRQTSAELAKWILTTLLALNAGGLVGVAQLEIEAAIKVSAAIIFVLGILLPLFSAQLSIRASLELSMPMGKAQGYWRAVSHNGYRVRQMEIDQMSLVPNALAKSKWPYRLGYASITCFILGVATAIGGLL